VGKWVPCHPGMARPQVPDGGDGLHIWRVAANILNKQSWTADMGWPFNLGVGLGANNPHRKTSNLLRIVIASDHDGFFGTTQAPKKGCVDGRMGSKWTLGRLVGGGCGVDSPGSG
jgi:hypothetical protein